MSDFHAILINLIRISLSILIEIIRVSRKSDKKVQLLKSFFVAIPSSDGNEPIYQEKQKSMTCTGKLTII